MLRKMQFRRTRRIIVQTPLLGKMFRHISDTPIDVVPNGADPELFDVPAADGQAFRSRFEWLQDRPLVVYTGSFGLLNGVDYLARLAAAVKRLAPEVRFLALGGGKQEQYIRETATQLGVLGSNFFMPGRLPKLEMPKVLSAADVATSLFIDLPEMWANSANKFFDALASSTPVAINYQGWQAELLRETGAGIVLDVNGVESAAERLVQVLHDPDWLRQAGAAARKLAVERFSRELLAQQLESVLSEAVG